MPNPNDPDEAQCQRCYDSGVVPGTDRPCSCRGIPITNPPKERSVNDAQKAVFGSMPVNLVDLNIPEDHCGCYTCLSAIPSPALGLPITASVMVVCDLCGNKRCPRATHHDNECTGSNDVGQPGSRYEGGTNAPA